MKRMVTQGHWQQWKTDKNLFCKDMVKIMFRCEQPMACYISPTKNFKDEMMIGYTENGEMEVMCDRKGHYVRVQTEGRAWFKTFEAAHPVERTSDTIYTSLERPSRLSPEMEAVMRMVRKNEIEREQQREENRRIQEDLGRITAANIAAKSKPQRAPKAEKTEPVSGGKQKGGATDTEEPESGESGASVPELDEST